MIPKMIRFNLDYSRNIYFHMLVEGSLCRLKLESEFKFYVSFKFDNQQIFSKIIELANYIILKSPNLKYVSNIRDVYTIVYVPGNINKTSDINNILITRDVYIY